VAILSNMEQPLGYKIGNALEIKEAIETLKGEGPDDLTELAVELGSHMVVLANKAKNVEEAKDVLLENISNGKAIEIFKKFVEDQGGDKRIVDQPGLLPRAKYETAVFAHKSGYISRLVADEIGKAAMMLGAGRQTKDSIIDLAVGITLHKK